MIRRSRKCTEQRHLNGYVIALLRQVGIEPRSPLGLVLVGASIIVLAVVMRYDNGNSLTALERMPGPS